MMVSNAKQLAAYLLNSRSANTQSRFRNSTKHPSKSHLFVCPISCLKLPGSELRFQLKTSATSTNISFANFILINNFGTSCSTLFNCKGVAFRSSFSTLRNNSYNAKKSFFYLYLSNIKSVVHAHSFYSAHGV